MPKKPKDAAHTRFLEALNKKKQRGVSGTGIGPDAGSKVGQGQASRNAPKRFQRKSGSA